MMGSAARVYAPERESDYVLHFGDIEVNFDRNTVTRAGTDISLTPAEFELLRFFVVNPGRELTRDMILASVWSYLASPNTRTVDAHVLRLRQKFEPAPAEPRHFVTVYRVGYSFRP